MISVLAIAFLSMSTPGVRQDRGMPEVYAEFHNIVNVRGTFTKEETLGDESMWKARTSYDQRLNSPLAGLTLSIRVRRVQTEYERYPYKKWDVVKTHDQTISFPLDRIGLVGQIEEIHNAKTETYMISLSSENFRNAFQVRGSLRIVSKTQEDSDDDLEIERTTEQINQGHSNWPIYVVGAESKALEVRKLLLEMVSKAKKEG